MDERPGVGKDFYIGVRNAFLLSIPIYLLAGFLIWLFGG
jgi:hypothetical protein